MKRNSYSIGAIVVAVVIVIAVLAINVAVYATKRTEPAKIVDCSIEGTTLVMEKMRVGKQTVYYTKEKTVYAYTVETDDGNLWDFTATEDLRERKDLTIFFSTNGTEDILDDEVFDYYAK